MNVAAQIMENSSFAGHPVAREDQGTLAAAPAITFTDTALNMLSFRKTLAGSLPSNDVLHVYSVQTKEEYVVIPRSLKKRAVMQLSLYQW